MIKEEISIAINIDVNKTNSNKSQTYITRSKYWFNFPWFVKERYQEYIKCQSDNRVLSILIAAIALLYLPVLITRTFLHGRSYSPLYIATYISLGISALFLTVHFIALILIEAEKQGNTKYSVLLRLILRWKGEWNLSNILMLVCLNTQGLNLLARVEQGQCDENISVWNSQECNPVAISNSIPHDVVLIIYLIPLAGSVFLKDCSMQATILGYFIGMTYISVALSLVDGIVQIYTVLYGLIFILCIFEIERASRLAFLYHQARQDLLYQVLPKGVAHAITSGASTQPTEHNEVCCFFSDIVNFTELTIAVGPYGIQKLLDSIYSLMDECVDECDGLWKVETIGDAYFCECGVVNSLGSMNANVDAILKFALLVQSRIKTIINPVNGLPIQLRIGIHCGSCVAGLVGSRRLMPHYSLFGNIVNLTNRIESTGSAGMIHVSNDVVEVARKSSKKWIFSKRGIVDLKGIGTRITWWLMRYISDSDENASIDSNEPTVITPHNTRSCPDFFNYNFDVRTVSEDNNSVANNIFIIFDSLFDLEQLVVDRVTLRRFIERIGTLYNDVPYHNFHHAYCVCQFAACLYYHNIIVPRLEAGCDIEHYDMNIWKPIFISLIAVMSHDVGHDGFNNSFHNKSNSPLSKTFFGQSPMENNHISITLHTLGMNGCDVFENWNSDYNFFVRNLIANSILATDMKLHDDVLLELSKDSESLQYFFIHHNVNDNSQTDFSDSQYEFMKLARVMLHTADISNSVRPSNISATFVDKLSCEFTRQVQEEARLGLPISTFMVINDEITKAKGEINFLSKCARPYFCALALIFPQCNKLVDSLDENIKYWETIAGNSQ